MLKRIASMLVAIATVLSLIGAEPVRADETLMPDTPEFELKVSDDESLITLTIAKTLNADGYRIYAKEPGSTKYRSVATIKKNGKKARTYTYSPFNPGKYSFSVKAYLKDGKTKVWSNVSARKKITIKSDIFSRVPVGIRFAEDVCTKFVCGSDEPGGSDRNRYKPEYECDEGLENATIRLFIVKSDGTRAEKSPFNYDETEINVGAIELGDCYAVLYAFKKSADAGLRNPIARSEKLKLSSVDENGNSKIKYADITFRDGYAYFGTAPTEQITDKTLKSKIIDAYKDGGAVDHGILTYKEERYTYDSQVGVGPFKFVPMEWRILEKTDEYALLMNNCIIGGGGYDGYKEAKTTTWKTSCLYYMLNRYNDYEKSERTYEPLWAGMDDRVLLDMDICGQETKVGIPSIDMLTDKTYGFSTSLAADKNRIVTPSSHYELNTNHNATRNGLKLYGMYWVANEKPGEVICVDRNGEILVGKFECNVYEIGVVNVIKVDLTSCNVFEE
ncbi:MAG: hypothetical protein K6E95_01955 [Lachnospiraceae bacterium]|nr:hypothetical protein [Lachnospiraceae bacterium]